MNKDLSLIKKYTDDDIFSGDLSGSNYKKI